MIKGLYAITGENLMSGDLLLQKVEAALAGGCRFVQYRDKASTTSERHRQAKALRVLCDRYGALLIINDHIELAKQVSADGVHLGQDDEVLDIAREQLGADAIIGATCHGSLALAKQAARAGASYLAFGRFYPSQTKPGAPPAPPELLNQVKSTLPLPTVAIGGINRDNASALIAAGADCLAVSYDLFRGDDLEEIRRRAARYVSLFEPAQEPR